MNPCIDFTLLLQKKKWHMREFAEETMNLTSIAAISRNTTQHKPLLSLFFSLSFSILQFPLLQHTHTSFGFPKKMLAAAASASRHLLQRDASIPNIAGGNRVRSLLSVSASAITPIRTTRGYGYNHGYGIRFNNRQPRTCPSLLFAIKGFLSDSSSSSSLHGRVTRPYLPVPQPVRSNA